MAKTSTSSASAQGAGETSVAFADSTIDGTGDVWID